MAAVDLKGIVKSYNGKSQQRVVGGLTQGGLKG
jgi:hypothetical protein